MAGPQARHHDAERWTGGDNMTTTAGILALLIFLITAPLSYLAFRMICWSDGAGGGPVGSDYLLAFGWPGIFLLLAVLFLLPLDRKTRTYGCVVAAILYIPVVAVTIHEQAMHAQVGTSLMCMLVLVPVGLLVMGLTGTRHCYDTGRTIKPLKYPGTEITPLAGDVVRFYGDSDNMTVAEVICGEEARKECGVEEDGIIVIGAKNGRAFDTLDRDSNVELVERPKTGNV
jgi:hypothetical protein